VSTFIQNNAPLTNQFENELVTKQQKRDDARERILKIALNAFANKGFDGVSTTELAKAAGVTQPLIHYHFKSKKSLWQTIVRNSFATLNEEFIQPSKRAPARNMHHRAELMIESFVRFIAQRTEFAKLMVSEGTQGSARMEWMVEELLMPCMQELKLVYQEGVQAGVLVDMPVSHLVGIVLGAASQFFTMSPLMASLFEVDTADSAVVATYTASVSAMLKKALIQPVV